MPSISTPVWSPYLIKDVTKLENVQRAFTKFACLRCSMPFNSYKDRLSKLNLKTLEYRRTIFDLILLFKIINNQSDLRFSDYFIMKQLPYPLRGGESRIEPLLKFKTNQLQNCFFNRIPSIWNALPNEIKSLTNITAFKRKLDQTDLGAIHNIKIEIGDEVI